MIAATLVAAVPASAQDGWQFQEAPPGYLFGPAFWVQENGASLSVLCLRFSQDIHPNPSGTHLPPVLLPRRLEVAVIWLGPNPLPPTAAIVGTSLGVGAMPPSSISFRIGDGQAETENWKTLFGYRQVVENDDAVVFLRRLLPPATRLTVFADFTDGKQRSETFDLTGFRDVLGRMEPRCTAVGSLLGDTGEPALPAKPVQPTGLQRSASGIKLFHPLRDDEGSHWSLWGYRTRSNPWLE